MRDHHRTLLVLAFRPLSLALVSAWISTTGCSHAPQTQETVAAPPSPVESKGSGKSCTEDDLREALRTQTSFKFDCDNTVIPVTRTLEIHRDGFRLDGAKKMILEWAGINNCAKRRDTTPLIDVRGQYNQIVGIEFKGAPTAIRIAEGLHNELKDLKFTAICNSAITVGLSTSENEALNTRISDSRFFGAGDAAIRLEKGSALIEDNRFEDCSTPITGRRSSKIVARRNHFQGDGQSCKQAMLGNERALLQARDNMIEGCQTAITLKDHALAEVSNNVLNQVKTPFQQGEHTQIIGKD